MSRIFKYIFNIYGHIQIPKQTKNDQFFADVLGKICYFLLFSLKLVALANETADWILSRDDDDANDDVDDEDEDVDDVSSVDPFCFLCTLSSWYLKSYLFDEEEEEEDGLSFLFL